MAASICSRVITGLPPSQPSSCFAYSSAFSSPPSSISFSILTTMSRVLSSPVEDVFAAFLIYSIAIGILP
jgi:hypothetical protein